MARKRLCAMCDDTTTHNPCERCGADTDPWPIDAEPPEPDGEAFRGREASGHLAEQQAQHQRVK